MDNVKLNPNIIVPTYSRKKHLKATEEYLEVIFKYPSYKKEVICWIPLLYRRTGTEISNDKNAVDAYLNRVYTEMNPANAQSWKKQQQRYWRDHSEAQTTKKFFDVLSKDAPRWYCQGCELPNNPNWARRIQDLKEAGYTLATSTSRYCEHCRAKKTHLMLIPIPRVEGNGNGYETWSSKLRTRIVKVLKNWDAYEGKTAQHLLPDHKFPEIRWDKNTKGDNPDSMTDEEINRKFQLLTNQRNQQKREVCRVCYQTNRRGTIYGIEYFPQGNPDWDSEIVTRGKEAEAGCLGCPWYDIQAWREALIKKLKQG